LLYPRYAACCLSFMDHSSNVRCRYKQTSCPYMFNNTQTCSHVQLLSARSGSVSQARDRPHLPGLLGLLPVPSHVCTLGQYLPIMVRIKWHACKWRHAQRDAPCHVLCTISACCGADRSELFDGLHDQCHSACTSGMSTVQVQMQRNNMCHNWRLCAWHILRCPHWQLQTLPSVC
jgi:hypothetical protein